MPCPARRGLPIANASQLQASWATPHRDPAMTPARNPFTALPLAPRALLWCLRMQAMQARRGADTEPRVDAMLGQLGAPMAAPPLRRLVRALLHGAARELQVLCVCQTEVAADERALLGLLALAQARRPLDAFLVLRGVLPAADAGAALRDAEGIGGALAAAGRLLPAPGSTPRRFATAPGTHTARLARHALH